MVMPSIQNAYGNSSATWYGYTPKGTGYSTDIGQRQAAEAQRTRRMYEDSAYRSAAEKMMQTGIGQTQRAMAGQATGRGANPLAERAALYGGGEMAAQATAQAGVMRAQETAQARQQEQQSMQAWMDAALKREQMSEAGYLAREQLLLAEDAQDWGKTTDIIGMFTGGLGGALGGAMGSDERMKYKINLFDEDEPATPNTVAPTAKVAPKEDTTAQKGAKAVSKITEGMSSQMHGGERAQSSLSGLGILQSYLGAAQMSDKEQKKNVTGSNVTDAEMRDALEKIRTYSYEYKPEAQRKFGLPPGQKTGVMAQDLEKAGPPFRGAVGQLPGGEKVIDGENALTATLAALASVSRRLEAIEGKGRGIPSTSSGPGGSDAPPREYWPTGRSQVGPGERQPRPTANDRSMASQRWNEGLNAARAGESQRAAGYFGEAGAIAPHQDAAYNQELAMADYEEELRTEEELRQLGRELRMADEVRGWTRDQQARQRSGGSWAGGMDTSKPGLASILARGSRR